MIELGIDPEGELPPYDQLRRQLAAMIADGSLPVGSRLPTVRALAGQLGIAVNTVARSYRELEAAGLVETRGRGGTYVGAGGVLTRQRAREAAEAYAAAVHALGIDSDEALRIIKGVLHVD